MSQNQDLQLLDNTLTFINTSNYDTVEEAIACGAAYVSADITAIESYTNGFRIPLYDLQDTLHAYSECLGHSDIRGFVRTSKGYVSINDLD